MADLQAFHSVDLPGATHALACCQDDTVSRVQRSVLLALGALCDTELRGGNGYEGHCAERVAGVLGVETRSVLQSLRILTVLGLIDAHVLASGEVRYRIPNWIRTTT